MIKSISTKSRTVTFLLALFLGVWGAHRFYAGKTGSAIAMLLITLTFVGAIITSLWAFIDFLMIAGGAFEDKDGAIIKNW